MSDWSRMNNPAVTGGVTFVATYERPEWAHQMTMACGHSAASYDLAGRCMWPGCPSGYQSNQGLTEAIDAIIKRHQK